MLSLNARLLVAASVVLVGFLGLTGLTVDKAFRESAWTATRDQLRAQIYALLSAADVDTSEQLRMPETLPEVRFSIPGSGLQAQVMDADGQILWRSPSALGTSVDFPTTQAPGAMQFEEAASMDGAAFFTMVFAVTWETGPDRERRFVFQVAESQQGYEGNVSGFRRSLWGWLVVATVVLLAVQSTILRWSLAPLRRVTHEVHEIEAGKRTTLATDYPRELRHLTDNLNALIKSSRVHLERYRNALGDLAHSLKTPLAILRGAVDSGEARDVLLRTVGEQVDRMDQTVGYQLQRAAASGRTALTAPIAVRPVVRKIMSSLNRVYRDKNVELVEEIEPDSVFAGDSGDLMEIVGNLADNAWKWTQSRVEIRAGRTSAGLVIEVLDDGPGIPPEDVKTILTRGVRADSGMEGHGIGLSVVRELVAEVYRGTLHIDNGPLGGAHVRVTLPN